MAKKQAQGVPEAPAHLLKAGEPESYTCSYCNKPVGAERVLVLTAGGQVHQHPECHEFERAAR